ncbi:hypothetical protein GCM10027568_18070 [Humibacter soli]
MPEQPEIPVEDATVEDRAVDGAQAQMPVDVATPTEPAVADQRLLEAHELARNALVEITTESSIGPIAGHVVEGERVLSLLFECTLPGYPGWHWTVTLARVDGEAEPVVLEAELLPGEQALLAPDWVPWSERLAEYQAAQEAARAAGLETDDGASDDEDEDDVSDDDDDEDDSDDDFGDDELDGIDIDLHDENGDDDIDLEADDITGAESASLEPGVSEPGVSDSGAFEGDAAGAPAAELGVDEADETEHDAHDGRGDDPAGA